MKLDRELQPKGTAWRPAGGIRLPPLASQLSYSAWTNGRVLVISALELADYPTGVGSGPQWHLSISAFGKRAEDKLCQRALKAFGLARAEEDNHEPGNARHFWLPVDPAHRVDCECKADEVPHVEPNGHRWTNDPDPAQCRGCGLERLIGKPCPIHGGRSVTP